MESIGAPSEAAIPQEAAELLGASIKIGLGKFAECFGRFFARPGCPTTAKTAPQQMPPPRRLVADGERTRSRADEAAGYGARAQKDSKPPRIMSSARRWARCRRVVPSRIAGFKFLSKNTVVRKKARNRIRNSASLALG